LFWLANLLFCITATIIVLRYEFFPMLIITAFPFLLIDWLDKKEKSAALSAPSAENRKLSLDLTN